MGSRAKQHNSQKPGRRSSGRREKERGGNADNRRSRRHRAYSDEDEASGGDWQYETKREEMRTRSEDEEYGSMPDDLNTVDRKDSDNDDWENQRKYQSRRPNRNSNDLEDNLNEEHSEASEPEYSDEPEERQKDNSSERKRGYKKKKRRKNTR